MKTLDENFRDWEASAFGFGYGTGEPQIIPALKAFLAAIPPRSEGRYDYKTLETPVGSVVAWLLINALCHAGMIDYGSSPRYGWLTDKGAALKAYVDEHGADHLLATLQYDQDAVICSPTSCNCGPRGYEKGRVCSNPFWGT